MSDLVTQSVSMVQQNVQDQMAVSVLKANAQADQAVAKMLEDNAKQIAAASAAATARGGIDIYA